MPIPTTSMGACLRFVRKEHSDWKRDKRLAVCLEKTGKSKKGDKK